MEKPPKGYAPIPRGKKGGYRKKTGGKWVYWYPEGRKPVRGEQLGLFASAKKQLEGLLERVAEPEGTTKPWISGQSSPTGKGMRILSLFSGVGGLDLGLSRALPDAEHVGMVEQNPFARKVLERQFPGVPQHGDVRDVARAAKGGNLPVRPNVVVGGFPCTDISRANQAACGIEGARSGLYSEMLEIVESAKPDWVVYENVPVLRSRGLEVVLADHRRLGYEVSWDGVPANAVGAPHLRDRIFVVAHPKEADFKFRKPDQYDHWDDRRDPPVLSLEDWEGARKLTRKQFVQQHMAAGNAVVPAVGEHIGKLLSESRSGQRDLSGARRIASWSDEGWRGDDGELVTKWPRAGVMRGDKVYQVESAAPLRRAKAPKEGQLVWIRNPDPNVEHPTTAEILGLSEEELDLLQVVHFEGEPTYEHGSMGSRLDPGEVFEAKSAEAERKIMDRLVERGYMEPDYSVTLTGAILGINTSYGESVWRRDRGGVDHENHARVFEFNAKDNVVAVQLAAGVMAVVPMDWVQSYPTPATTEYKGGAPAEARDPEVMPPEPGDPDYDPRFAWRKRGGQLRHWTTGKVNPDLSRYLMGFPEGWLDDAPEEDVMKALDSLRTRASWLSKAEKAPKGFSAIPNSKHGGHRKKMGNGGYVYWYPGGKGKSKGFSTQKKSGDVTSKDALFAMLDGMLPPSKRPLLVKYRDLVESEEGGDDIPEAPSESPEAAGAKPEDGEGATMEEPEVPEELKELKEDLDEVKGRVQLEVQRHEMEQQRQKLHVALEEFNKLAPGITEQFAAGIRSAIQEKYGVPEEVEKALAPSGKGWHPVPRSLSGGFRRPKGGGGYDYWYPGKTELPRQTDMFARQTGSGSPGAKGEAGRDDRPQLTILSMGLGRDSITMLLLAKEGRLMVEGEPFNGDDLDAVVFSDTGWEWPHTYALIPRVQKLCDELNVPFIHIKKPKAEGKAGWKRYYKQRMERTRTRTSDLAELESRELSMVALGQLSIEELSSMLPDRRSKLNEDRETRAAGYLRSLATALKRKGTVKKPTETDAEWQERIGGPFRQDHAVRFDPQWVAEGRYMPTVEERADSGYYHRRGPIVEDYTRLCKITLRANPACTFHQKILPINDRLVNDMSLEKFGVGKNDWKKKVKAGKRPKHRVLIGIAADEVERFAGADAARKKSSHILPVHPLREMGIPKGDEQEILDRHGFGDTRKSGCVGCHFQPISWFYALQEVQPEAYQQIVEYEQRAIQYAIDEGLTVKYLKGTGPLSDQVERWREKNPDATVDAILDKEYGRKVPGQVVLEDDGNASSAYQSLVQIGGSRRKVASLGDLVGELLYKATGSKYCRREPTGNPKRPWRYYYGEECGVAGARQYKEGDILRLGRHKVEIESVDEDGTVQLKIPGEKSNAKLIQELYGRIPPRFRGDEWSTLLSKHYGAAYQKSADKRARQAVNAILRHVPAHMLQELSGSDAERLDQLKTRSPEVYARLERAFRQAGMDAVHAKRVIQDTLAARGWDNEARAALLGNVVDTRHAWLAKNYKRVIRATNNSRTNDQGDVTARQVQAAIDILRPGGPAANVDKLMSAAETEILKLAKMLVAARKDPAAAIKVLEQAIGNPAISELMAVSRAVPEIRATQQPLIKREPLVLASERMAREIPSLPKRPPTRRGADTQVMVAGENGAAVALPGYFKLMEAGEAIPSHKGDTFARHPEYPEGLQERAYHRDKAEQEKVRRNAKRMKPAFLINTNPDALNGPPIMTSEGIVLGGNSRTMSMQQVYAEHPAKADELRAYLRDNLGQVGLQPQDMEGMKHPILVRVVDTTGHDTKVLVRQMNESFIQGMDPRTLQVAMGRRLDEDTISVLADSMKQGETLRAFLDDKRSRPFLDALSKAGIVDARNVAQYVKKATGLLNDDGKRLVERILVGRVVGDPDLLSNTGDRVVGSVAGAIPHMLQAESVGSGYSLRKELTQAMHAFNRMHDLNFAPDPKVVKAGGKKLDSALQEARGQLRDLFEGEHPVIQDEKSGAMFDLLVRLGGRPRRFAAVFREFANQTKHHPEGQEGLLGERPSPEQVFNRSIKAAVDKQAKADAEKAAAEEAKRKKKAAAEEAQTGLGFVEKAYARLRELV